MQQRLHHLATALEAQLIEDRRDGHRFPEVGWTEFRTSARIATRLHALGYRVRLGRQIIDPTSMLGVPDPQVLHGQMERAIAEGADAALVRQMAGGLTGVVAELACGPGPVLALRFDIDANDITEATDPQHRPFREGFHSCHPGVMHACGHDGHIAIGLGVAKLLAEIRDQLHGTIRFMFQPAEEGVRGAAPMVAAGVLADVDFLLGGHLGFLARQPGQLICGCDKFLATTKFDVAFRGTPAHAGGAPEQGNNALLAAACAALNLHAISRHSQGASRITVGRLEAGQGRNIIPAHGLLKVETRGENTEIDAFMFARAQEVIAGAATMYGVEHALTLMGKSPSATSSQAMIDALARVAAGIGFFAPESIKACEALGGSEDFALMLNTVQSQGGMGTYFVVGTHLAAGHHDHHFDFDECCLVPGVELMSGLALALLGPDHARTATGPHAGQARNA
jgi:aminobenzoyl-glutamate utilization protein A